MVLETFTKYLFNALATSCRLVSVIFSITVKGTQFKDYIINISFLIPYQVFFRIINIDLKIICKI